MVISHLLHAQTTLPLGTKFQAPAGQEAGPVLVQWELQPCHPAHIQSLYLLSYSGSLWLGMLQTGQKKTRETDSTIDVASLRTNAERRIKLLPACWISDFTAMTMNS
jgi:hypothetical protein